MHTESTNQNHYIRAAVLFAACLFAVFLLPYLGFLLNSSFFFFAPQRLFPYDGMIVRNEHGSRAIFSHSVGLSLTIVQWTLAATGFAWFARRLSVVSVIFAAVGTIVALGIIVLIGFSLFGVTLELDGL